MLDSYYTNIEDDVLLIRLKQGDEIAFTNIYERYNKMLYVLAYKYLKDTFLAEDVVQQVFLKLWESRSLMTASVHLRNYLYTIAKNMVLNEIRDNATAVEKNYELVQRLPLSDNRLNSLLEAEDLKQQFKRTMRELTEQQQKVCRLKIFGGYSNQEVAELMHISVSTVKSHYALGIKYLRSKMKQLLMVVLAFILLVNSVF